MAYSNQTLVTPLRMPMLSGALGADHPSTCAVLTITGMIAAVTMLEYAIDATHQMSKATRLLSTMLTSVTMDLILLLGRVRGVLRTLFRLLSYLLIKIFVRNSTDPKLNPPLVLKIW